MTGRRLARSRLPVIVVVAAALGILLVPSSAAWAQPAGGTPPAATNKDLGENIKTAANVGPFGNQIQGFIDDRVKALAGTDAAEQARAREDLVRQVTPGAGGAAPTRAFLTDYSTRLNGALMPLMQSADTRVRLNAAIVAAKVSQGAGGTALVPVTRALLKDASDGVMLWALRGAQANLPASVAAGGEPLVPTIVSIGATRPRVINGVYQALVIPTKDPKLIAVLVPATHAVLDARVKQYQSGLPHDPFADVRAVTYLVGQDEYQGQSVQQKQTTAQRVSDLLAVAAQRAGDLSNEQRQEVVEMIRSVGSALSVIGQREGNDPVQQIGLKLRALPRSASAKELQDNVAPVFAALQAVPRFKGLTAPPQVGPMTAPADPATRPPPAPTTASTAPGGGR